MGHWVDITARDGGTFQSYVAVPSAGSGPGLVLLQEAFGVTEFMRDTANRYADLGFVVSAPDLYWRIEPHVELTDDDFDRAMEIYGQFDFDRAFDDMGATMDALRAMPEQSGKLGAIGYCLGGRLAVVAAAREGADCAVSFYGVSQLAHVDELESLTVPVAFHTGDQDHQCAADIPAITELAARHETMTSWVYPGVGHAFVNRFRKHYVPDAADLAWQRTLEVLSSALGVPADASS